MLAEGQRVRTEWGDGVVQESSPRRAVIVLDDDGGTLNIATGTPGYARVQEVPPC